MKLEILAKNYDVGQNFETVAEKKLTRLDKYFEDDCKAKMVCKKENNTFSLEITVFSNPVLRAESRNAEDMYTNIDLAITKLIRQIHRHKDRMGDKVIRDFIKETEVTKYAEEEKPATLVKKKSYTLEPMKIEDALAELEMLDHNFFVYLDNQSGRVNVLYKRLDGDYGLIETIT